MFSRTPSLFSRALRLQAAAHPRRLAAAAAAPTARYRTHTTDSYTKEVDSSPAADSKIHRVDPSSENVQKPHEPPSGPWSATGVDAGVKNAQGRRDESAQGEGKSSGEKATGMKEYSTMSGERPYHAVGQGDRYGGTEHYQADKGRNESETSTSAAQGPEGAESGGRKPEGR